MPRWRRWHWSQAMTRIKSLVDPDIWSDTLIFFLNARPTHWLLQAQSILPENIFFFFILRRRTGINGRGGFGSPAHGVFLCHALLLTFCCRWDRGTDKVFRSRTWMDVRSQKRLLRRLADLICTSGPFWKKIKYRVGRISLTCSWVPLSSARNQSHQRASAFSLIKRYS